MTVQPTIYAQYPLNLLSKDYLITKETICAERRVCDILKLHGPDTVCNTGQSVKITATKNRYCEGKIVFSFDTSAIAAYAQPDDTTLLLSFDKTLKGTIWSYALLSFFEKFNRNKCICSISGPESWPRYNAL
jgi:hypothetical protein